MGVSAGAHDWHDHPGLRFVEPLLTLAITNRSSHMLRDSRIAQPERSTGVVQSAILRDERMTGRRITDAGWRDRQRTVKAPGYEQVLTFRLKVRQFSSILCHQMAVPKTARITV